MAHFDRCIEPATEAQQDLLRFVPGDIAAVVVGFYSAEGFEGFEGFDPGAAFAPVIGGLDLTFPDLQRPCPTGLAAPVLAVDMPLRQDDGWVIWPWGGLDVVLPGAFQPALLHAQDGFFEAGALFAESDSHAALSMGDYTIAFWREIMEDLAEQGEFLSGELRLGDLGRFTWWMVDLSADERRPQVSLLVFSEDLAEPLGLRVETVMQPDAGSAFDAAAVLAMKRRIISELAASADRPDPALLVIEFDGR